MNSSPVSYSPDCAALLAQAPLNVLGPGSPQEEFRARLEALDHASLFGERKVVDRSMADCCRSALWLRFDFLAESHALSQEISSVSGSYWHGIMHRREPDYVNAKYWFRRVESHPVFAPLARQAAALVAGCDDPRLALLRAEERWDPLRFVDLCAQLASDTGDSNLLARRIAAVEWQLLFDDCYRRA